MKLYSLLDVETTGWADSGPPVPQQIIEVAAIVVDETGAIQRTYYGRFTPTIPVLPGAAKVNGYAPEAWAEQSWAPQARALPCTTSRTWAR